MAQNYDPDLTRLVEAARAARTLCEDLVDEGTSQTVDVAAVAAAVHELLVEALEAYPE